MAQQTDDGRRSTDQPNQALRAFHRAVWREMQQEDKVDA
jgi:hypothetical protein